MKKHGEDEAKGAYTEKVLRVAGLSKINRSLDNALGLISEDDNESSSMLHHHQ